jgi:hypothetical protein
MIVKVVGTKETSLYWINSYTEDLDLKKQKKFVNFHLLSWLRANAVVATVLGSIFASSDTVDSEGWQIKQC